MRLPPHDITAQIRPGQDETDDDFSARAECLSHARGHVQALIPTAGGTTELLQLSPADSRRVLSAWTLHYTEAFYNSDVGGRPGPTTQAASCFLPIVCRIATVSSSCPPSFILQS